MANEKQVHRIKYLRGNGLSQKEIAEDVGLSPQMVSVVLKKTAEKFSEYKPVKIISALGFVPKDTVIEFSPMEFENYREGESLYATGSSLFEMRSGVVHKTSFPDCCPVDLYPMVADLLPRYELPIKLFEKSSLCADFTKKTIGNLRLRPESKCQRSVQFILDFYLMPSGIKIARTDFEALIHPMAELVSELLSEQLSDLNQGYLEDMPEQKNKEDLIRYHMEKRMTSGMLDYGSTSGKNFSEFEEMYFKSMSAKYPFLIDIVYNLQKDPEQLTFDIEEDFTDLFNEALSKISLGTKDIKFIFKYGTLDKNTIERYLETGAKSSDELEAIEEHGVANLDELKAAKIAFNNQPIQLSEYNSFAQEKGRLPEKVRKAVERNEIDDALIHAFVRFENKALCLWTHPYVEASVIPRRWRDGDEMIEHVVQSNLSYSSHLNHIQSFESYVPSQEELAIIRNWVTEAGKAHPELRHQLLRGNTVNAAYAELYCRNLFRSKIVFPKKLRHNKTNEEPTSEILISLLAPSLSQDGELHQFCEQARLIRNKLMHDDEIQKDLVTRHVRAILELTELVIAETERLEHLG